MRRNSFGLYLGAVVTSVVILLPFYWEFVSAISPMSELISTPPHLFPEHPTMGNFISLFTGKGESMGVAIFLSALKNSFGIAAVTTAICVAIGSLAAYALARFKPRFEKSYLKGVLVLSMFPPIALSIAMYAFTIRLGIYDTWWALILVYSSFTLPYVIWMMHGFFLTIPKEIEEAALIDGATPYGVFLKVVLPMSVNGLATTATFSFLTAWDEFMFALILTSSPRAKTVTVAISEFVTHHMMNFGLMMAGGVVAALPPLLIGIIFQKWLIKGLTSGAIK